MSVCDFGETIMLAYGLIAAGLFIFAVAMIVRSYENENGSI